MAKPNWAVNESSAQLAADNWSSKLDISNCSNGMELKAGGQPVAAQLFSFLLNDKPIDVFVRDTDLVLRYPPRSSDLVSYETYFRASESGRGLELILSAQTHLLESKPETKVTSRFANASVLAKAESSDQLQELNTDADFSSDNAIDYFVVRPEETATLSILLMSHPSDFHRASVQPERGSISFWVFPHSLEKGVIRRARFQMQLLDRSADEAEAARIFANAELASPPLAT